MSQVERVGRERVAVPVELESARAKLIYLYLDRAREAGIDEIAEDLEMPLIALCRILNTLEEKGLVVRDGERYCCES